MKEIWKDIEGYEGKYQVSNYGRVKSLSYRQTGQERVMRLWFDARGYLRVALYKGDERKYYTVHRLVAQAFIPNTDNKPCVDHISTDKTDNRVENLRWVTLKENSNNLLTKKRLIGNQRRAKKVFCENTIYDSIKYCAEHYNVKQSTMSYWLIGTHTMPTDFQEKGLRYFIEKENDK